MNPLRPTLYLRSFLPLPPTWERAQIWLHKPPLATWLIMLSLQLCGLSELAVRLPSAIFFCAAIYATFRIGAILYGDQIGLVAAAMLALNGQLLGLASGRNPTDHPESLFASLICLGVWIALEQTRGSAVRAAALAALLGAVTGLAILTKSLPALIVFAVWLAWAGRPLLLHVALALGTCAAVALPWQLYIAHAFPAEAAAESAYALAHLTRAVEGHGGGPLYHLARLGWYFGELAPLALIWFVVRRRASRAGRALLVWFALPYLFFSLIATKMPGYPLFAAPAICLMVACAAAALLEPSRAAAGLAARLPALLALALVLLPVRTALVVWHPFRRFDEQRAAARELRALREVPGPVAFFAAPRPIELMFYVDQLSYDQLPDAEARERAARAGYRVEIMAPRSGP